MHNEAPASIASHNPGSSSMSKTTFYPGPCHRPARANLTLRPPADPPRRFPRSSGHLVRATGRLGRLDQMQVQHVKSSLTQCDKPSKYPAHRDWSGLSALHQVLAMGERYCDVGKTGPPLDGPRGSRTHVRAALQAQRHETYAAIFHMVALSRDRSRCAVLRDSGANDSSRLDPGKLERM